MVRSVGTFVLNVLNVRALGAGAVIDGRIAHGLVHPEMGPYQCGAPAPVLPGLFSLLRARLTASLGGYPGLPEHAAADFVRPAALGALSGPAGALVLAATAVGG